jgi:RNA polymerase sigma-70 factor, ECF subfamily
MADIELSETNAAGVIHHEDRVSEQEEQALVASARSGDSAAFERLVVPLRRRILRLAQRILRSQDDAEDVVQIALLQAFGHLNGFEGKARFSSWLIRITVNTALMRLRTLRRKSETSLDQLADDYDATVRFEAVETRLNPEQAYSEQERFAILAEALSQLGLRNRTVLDLHHLQQLSPKEIAEVLGVPVTIVKARLYRARHQLIQSARSILSKRAMHLAARHRNQTGRRTSAPRLQTSEV